MPFLVLYNSNNNAYFWEWKFQIGQPTTLDNWGHSDRISLMCDKLKL